MEINQIPNQVEVVYGNDMISNILQDQAQLI